MSDPLQKLVATCKEFSNGTGMQNQLESLNQFPVGIKKYIQEWNGEPLCPEPFYGYFEDDMSQDTLLLLLNPGWVEESGDRMNRWNTFVKERYLTWGKQDYMTEKNRLPDILIKGYQWREKRRRQIEAIVGETGFLHTIEYFPYHTKNWPIPGKANMEWIHNSTSTRLCLNAVHHIAEHGKVKYIFGIGKAWVDIFGRNDDRFQLVDYKEIRKANTDGISHRIYKYKAGEQSMPIIVYVSGAGGIYMPRNVTAVSLIRNMLD